MAARVAARTARLVAGISPVTRHPVYPWAR